MKLIKSFQWLLLQKFNIKRKLSYIVLYHASLDRNLKTMIPRVPERKMKNEDSISKRICFSPSILGALTASSKFRKDDIVYIYKYATNDYYQPSPKQVIDAPITGELWIEKDIDVEIYCKVKIKAYNKNYSIEGFVYSFEFVD